MSHHRITPAERAVYHLVESTGGLDDAHCSLYRHQIAALREAGLVLRHPDGVTRIVPSMAAPAETIPPRATAETIPPPAPSPAPSSPPRASTPPEGVPMATLVVRVPPEWLDVLEGMARPGETRSDVVRGLLGRAIAGSSGARRRVTHGSAA